MYTLLAPEVREESKERIRRRALRLPVTNEFETVGLRSDGSTFPVEIIVAEVMLADGRAEIGFLTDITERKQAEEQIAEQAAFLDEARDAIIVRDIEGKILFWNKGADASTAGRARKSSAGMSSAFSTLLQKNSMNSTALTVTQGEWHGELQHLTKDGRKLIVEVRCSLIRDHEGRPKSILSINTDITERKKIEAQFMRAQRMESIGTLAGGIAHDLNNILAPIMMSIEVLKQRATDPQSQSILETIACNSKRGAAIVRQLLSFARGTGRRTAGGRPLT